METAGTMQVPSIKNNSEAAGTLQVPSLDKVPAGTSCRYLQVLPAGYIEPVTLNLAFLHFDGFKTVLPHIKIHLSTFTGS